MDFQKLTQKLENIIEDSASSQRCLGEFNKRIMVTHYLLARIHGKRDNLEKAQAHLGAAEREFINMCIVLYPNTYKIINVREYVNGFKGRRKKMKRLKSTSARNGKIERELLRYQAKLLSIALKVNYDPRGIIAARTTSDDHKKEIYLKRNVVAYSLTP